MTTPSRHYLAAALCAALALGAAGALATAPAAAPAGAAFTTLHTVVLSAQEVSGVKMQELSGLGWDADEELLYAVSDRGSVFHLQLELGAARIEKLVPVWAVALRDPRNASRKFNAEGLSLVNAKNGVKGDTQLIVALEDGPSVLRFTPRGEAVADVELPPALRDPKSYRKSKRLEAVSAHPEHGFVMAPEVALRSEPANTHTLHATGGGTWSFTALHEGSNVKAIETLPDGTLLVLERLEAGRAPTAGLRHIDPASCGAERTCATGDAPAGNAGLAEGNFEGMAGVSGGLFLLVTDGGIDKQGAAGFALVRLGTK
ncbi:MAG: esterase-like activity of phytase family protein [Methylibium sp.]|nr:esterase-like activity of phytase family protein [Methylibium sp.]